MSSLRPHRLGIVLLASMLMGADASGAPSAESERGRAVPSGKAVTPPAPADGLRRDSSKAERDEEIIQHLDEIERLELLQHLELFDTAGKRK